MAKIEFDAFIHYYDDHSVIHNDFLEDRITGLQCHTSRIFDSEQEAKDFGPGLVKKFRFTGEELPMEQGQ